VVKWKVGEGDAYMKRIFLWPALLVMIAGSWVGNVWYYDSTQLEEPLFLKHYITVNGYQSDMLELVYFENRRGSSKVTSVRIEELPWVRFHLHPENNYAHQMMMKATGIWMSEDIETMDKTPITIREVTVYFSEGEPRKVPIGEISLEWEERGEVLSHNWGSSSSDGTGSSSLLLNEAASLEKIELTHQDKIEPWLTVNMSGRAIEHLNMPVRFLKGNSLSVDYKWSIPDQAPAAFDIYQVKLRLYFKTEDGRSVLEEIPINHNTYISEKQLRRFVRSGGEHI
jgi:hypothetical protein